MAALPSSSVRAEPSWSVSFTVRAGGSRPYAFRSRASSAATDSMRMPLQGAQQAVDRPAAGARGQRTDDRPGGAVARQGVSALGPGHLEGAHVVAPEVQDVAVAQVERLLLEGPGRMAGDGEDPRGRARLRVHVRAVGVLSPSSSVTGGAPSTVAVTLTRGLREAVLREVGDALADHLFDLEPLEARQQAVDDRRVRGCGLGCREAPGRALLEQVRALERREVELLHLGLLERQDLLLDLVGLRLLLALVEEEVPAEAERHREHRERADEGDRAPWAP
jgi:hypothetical protein